MNKKIVIGNWKMQLSHAESVVLAHAVSEAIPASAVDVVVCPSATALSVVGALLPEHIALGAQDAHWKAKGAYTGQTSPAVLRELGVRFVLLGHSERREFLGETDAMIAKKAVAALANDLVPIICVGETMDERKRGEGVPVVEGQLDEILDALVSAAPGEIIVAYEPRWAISTGANATVATTEDAVAMIAVIRRRLEQACAGRPYRVIYGGSVHPKNVLGFLKEITIDGVLPGAASLDASAFAAMVTSAAGL